MPANKQGPGHLREHAVLVMIFVPPARPAAKRDSPLCDIHVMAPPKRAR